MKQSGFTLVEIIVAIALVAIFVPAIGMAMSFALRSSVQGESFSHAYALGEEGMEAIIQLKSLGDSSWDWAMTPINTVVGQYYLPTQSGGVWSLGSIHNAVLVLGTAPVRTIEINQVTRCGLDNHICIGGAPDRTTRKIIVTVLWLEQGKPQQVTLNSYVTQH